MSAQPLPVAEPGEVRRAAWRLIRSDRAAFIVVLLTNCAAAGAGLVGPWLLGQIVNEVQVGAGVATIDRWGLLVVLAAAAQLLIAYQARRLGYRFGERTAARLREQLADRLMRIPAGGVEEAGTGDLTSRATTDAGLVSFALRDAAPEMVFALAQALIIIVAVILLSPVLGVVGLVALVAIPVVLRWYLRRARSAYLAQAAANAEVADVLAGTAAGARTVEALGLQERRAADCSSAIAAATVAQLRTLRLRSVFFPTIDASTALAVGATFGVGGLLYLDHQLSLGIVVAAVFYLRQLSTPIDTILIWVETLQSSAASFARIEGLASSAEPPRPTGGTEFGVIPLDRIMTFRSPPLVAVNVAVPVAPVSLRSCNWTCTLSSACATPGNTKTSAATGTANRARDSLTTDLRLRRYGVDAQVLS